MRINKYLPVAFIYFFINSLALPFGLTYTAILSPLLYWWVVTKRKKDVLLPFLVALVPFLLVHIYQGVEIKSYMVSLLNYSMVYIFCQAFYTFLKVAEDKEKIFRKLLITNFILCIIAIPIYFTSFSNTVWMELTITDGLDNFLRLKLFTYEASYYALLFTPLFFFYFTQLILSQNKINSWLLLPMLLLPYILSFSIGAITCAFLSFVVVYFTYFGRLTANKRALSFLILSVSALMLTFVMLLLFFPGNSLFLRLENIITGKDTSGNGRTSEAFILAMKMLEQKSYAFGIGAGQVKVLGAEIVRDYYFYSLDYSNIAIPNATAETLAIFGWVGLSIRLIIELFLFVYTRVWKNYFRLMLFTFIFVYQFTGSFITNMAEYVIWILAFTNVFREFDVGKKAVSYKL